ncbi:DUF1295 domain-containing protein [Cognatilysobacter lacus]|uniref:DUF1295 domain-containing protein n=1 Tax=Cognatilysobacter lacus TaxID=1643323 RepID=A0A5D8Z6P1_9GAMM|nr:DUF1295 domain-containing protein [Lysobacter lacus]TZF90367.1 DUF1295 domain-containing protein [Lysobacter lacus]
MSAWRFLEVWAAMAVIMTIGWAWQQRTRNAGMVDVLWSLGVGASAIFFGCIGDGAPTPRMLVAVLGGAWGLRLATHLARRVLAEPEDGRYAHLRRIWNGSGVKFFALFQLQALLVPLFAMPFAAVARVPAGGAVAWTWVGVGIWVGALAGEGIADRQLARFRANPANRGRTCRAGLWAWSRHPNYFFEWLHWFAYAALAVGSPWAGLAWAGPVVMYVFLRWISGIPYTEAQALRTRGDDYRDYQRTTPMLFPRFPRRRAPRRAPA